MEKLNLGICGLNLKTISSVICSVWNFNYSNTIKGNNSNWNIVTACFNKSNNNDDTISDTQIKDKACSENKLSYPTEEETIYNSDQVKICEIVNTTNKINYPYKRRSHCIEKLDRLMNNEIPEKLLPQIQNVYDILNLEIINHNLNKTEISITFIERMLKKHKMHDFYEYVYAIYHNLIGTKQLTLTREEYYMVLEMFEDFEKAFKNINTNRVNFINYSVLLHKIFTLIGREDIAIHCKNLKSVAKMKETNKLYNKTATQLNWIKMHDKTYVNVDVNEIKKRYEERVTAKLKKYN
jgi:hypothetical protein